MQQGRFNQSGDIIFDNRPGDFDQLGLSFSGNFYFDKCLPMGAAVSCSLFEKNCYWAARTPLCWRFSQ
jgi:hypothetical protein